MLPVIHVLHENPDWLPPFADAFAARGEEFEDWMLVEKSLDLGKAPPEGIFYNRMSASSHTRGHRYSPELTSVVLAWLESHGRRVINDTRAIQLEVNKSAQYAALHRVGIQTPRTIAAVGKTSIREAVEQFAPGPVIVKPNRGGKGLGVQLYDTTDQVLELLEADGLPESLDGILLLQDYIKPPRSVITRAEFIGGKFFYAVEVDTSKGFELCPADNCAIDGAPEPPKFTIIDDIDADLKARAEQFLAANGIGMAGIEFIETADGAFYVYDVNTNTNYNPDAEAEAGRNAPQALVDWLIAERDRTYQEEKGRPKLSLAGWKQAS